MKRMKVSMGVEMSSVKNKISISLNYTKKVVSSENAYDHVYNSHQSALLEQRCFLTKRIGTINRIQEKILSEHHTYHMK